MACTVQEHITELTGKIGEKLDLTYTTLTAEKVASYIHSDNKKGVLVGLKNVGDGRRSRHRPRRSDANRSHEARCSGQRRRGCWRQ